MIKRRRGISSDLGSVNFEDRGELVVSDESDESDVISSIKNENQVADHLNWSDPMYRLQQTRQAQPDLNTAQKVTAQAMPEPIRQQTRADVMQKKVEELNLPSEEEAKQLLQQARQQRNERIGTVPKNRLEVLFGIARLTTSVVIDNLKFELRSLKSRENQQILSIVSKCTDRLDEIFSMRAYTLALAIFRINDQPAELIFGTSNLDELADLVDEFDESVLQTLFLEYNKMIKAHRDVAEKEIGGDKVLDNIKK